MKIIIYPILPSAQGVIILKIKCWQVNPWSVGRQFAPSVVTIRLTSLTHWPVSIIRRAEDFRFIFSILTGSTLSVHNILKLTSIEDKQSSELQHPVQYRRIDPGRADCLSLCLRRLSQRTVLKLGDKHQLKLLTQYNPFSQLSEYTKHHCFGLSRH